MKLTDLLRYVLWLGVLNTGNANRKFFGMPTTWVFHVTLNSFVLFLPDILRGANRVWQLDRRAKQKRDFLSIAYTAIDEVVLKETKYAFYVAPVALAYIVSHPHFNIYKGKWSKLRLFGFGLDAIPHSLTAFAFTNLVMDTFAALARYTPPDVLWRTSVERANKHSGIVAGAFLAAASTLYESGEYAIHKEELRETGGDESKINLIWSAQDTLFDLMSNTLGWIAALVLRRNQAKKH